MTTYIIDKEVIIGEKNLDISTKDSNNQELELKQKYFATWDKMRVAFVQRF